MNFYLMLPLLFLRFWFYEAPSEMLAFFGSVNSSFFQLFSLPLFVRTYFQPVKNEYRKGLVGFSIIMGILVKSFLIGVDVLLFAVLVSFEGIALSLFVLWPFITIFFLFL